MTWGAITATFRFAFSNMETVFIWFSWTMASLAHVFSSPDFTLVVFFTEVEASVYWYTFSLLEVTLVTFDFNENLVFTFWITDN
jgi:hypothetical protein